MYLKTVVSFVCSFYLLSGSEIFDFDINKNYKSKIKQKIENLLPKDFKNPGLIPPNQQTRDDEDLYGSWIAIDLLYYEDISFTNGTSIIDSADFETLGFVFYDDNTMDIWTEDGDYEEVDTFDWFTENDSLYTIDNVNHDDEIVAWYDITDNNELVIRVEDTEMFPGYPVYLEYIFEYEGEVDDDGAPECILDCPGINEAGEPVDFAFCEWFTGIDGDVCFDDCDQETTEELSELFDICEECIADPEYCDDDGGNDEECEELGEIFCESGDFMDQESCENNIICAWDEDQCWYACENDENCDCDGDDGGYEEYGCGDPDACNYDPDVYYYYDDCIYPEDYGWCDCDENIVDCNGDCGGDDFESCTIMYFESAGFYENSDCSGELITTMPGICIHEGYDEYSFIYLNEDDCLSSGGFWLEANTCYSQLWELMSEEECNENNGLSLEYGESCQFEQMPSQEECESQYGYFDTYTNECFLSDEYSCDQLGGIWEYIYFCITFIELPDVDNEDDCSDDYGNYGVWLEAEEFFENDIPNLYFSNDGTVSESCEYGCQLMDLPSQEDCENAGAEFDSWGECYFEEIPTPEDCEGQNGYYDYYNNECEIYDEEDCLSLSGYWDGNTECYVEFEGACIELNGLWYEGLCPTGEYEINEESMIISYYDPESGPGVSEAVLILELDENGNWDALQWDIQDWYGYGNCIGMTWSSSPTDLSINDSEITMPLGMYINSVYPNPFNPQTEIHYTIPKTEDVTISVFDITGKKVVVLKSEMQNAGEHSIIWNAEQMSSGVYFIRLQTDDKIKSQHVILLK